MTFLVVLHLTALLLQNPTAVSRLFFLVIESYVFLCSRVIVEEERHHCVLENTMKFVTQQKIFICIVTCMSVCRRGVDWLINLVTNLMYDS
jgi:hypothetical protein